MSHKEIVLNYEKTLNEKELRCITAFNATFPPEEVYLEGKKNTLIISLREVDIAQLQETVSRLDASLKRNLFADVLHSVENIKSYGIRSGKRNYVDYKKERKVKNRKEKTLNRAPYFYAQDHIFSQQNNPLPQKYTNKIITGDSEAILQKLPDNCVDLVFTSPPYNFGLEYSDSADTDFWQHYFNKLYAVFRQCIRVTKYGGRIIVNIQPLFSDYIPSHHMISNFFMQEKMIWKGEILWEKNNYNCKYTSWGSWKSPSSPYLKYTWEFIEIFCKGQLKKPGDKENIDISDTDFKKWVTGKWSIAPEHKMKKFGHPAMFPEELVTRILQLFSYKKDIVLDPFNGAGTTTAVAQQLKRNYLGIDISESYCQTAKQRLKEKNMELFEDD